MLKEARESGLRGTGGMIVKPHNAVFRPIPTCLSVYYDDLFSDAIKYGGVQVRVHASWAKL